MSCGCKASRGCLLCQPDRPQLEFEKDISYVYCPDCKLAWKGWDESSYKTHPNHEGESISIPGIFVQLDFISETEEKILMKGIDEMPWELSQSGRRKQNFGPKTNFKKKRLRIGEFKGFPEFSRFIQEKFHNLPLLSNYRTIEQCTLEYDPKRGATIDPHIDDCWVWGERIVTVNCLSDSTLTLTPYVGDQAKYNLIECSLYNRVVNAQGSYSDESSLSPYNYTKESNPRNAIIRIPMPRYVIFDNRGENSSHIFWRSLTVLYGEARYLWEHCVLREDILDRRVCIAYREFTPPYLPGGYLENEGSEILDAANSFWNHLYVKG